MDEEIGAEGNGLRGPEEYYIATPGHPILMDHEGKFPKAVTKRPIDEIVCLKQDDIRLFDIFQPSAEDLELLRRSKPVYIIQYLEKDGSLKTAEVSGDNVLGRPYRQDGKNMIDFKFLQAQYSTKDKKAF